VKREPHPDEAAGRHLYEALQRAHREEYPDRWSDLTETWRAAMRAAARSVLDTQAPAAPPPDPMETPLPCDVTVGHGTMRKGVPLRALVARTKVLYEMALGEKADDVAALTPEQRAQRFAAFQSELAAAGESAPCDSVQVGDPGKPAPVRAALLAWIGNDERHDQVGIRSIGTPLGVIPACRIDSEHARESFTHPVLLQMMQAVADQLSEPQRLVSFIAVKTVHEIQPAGHKH
jgi:hypothetical protein